LREALFEIVLSGFGFGILPELPVFRSGVERVELLLERYGISGVELGKPESRELFPDFPLGDAGRDLGDTLPMRKLQAVRRELPEEPLRVAIARYLARDADSLLFAAALPVAGHHGSVSREDLGRGGDLPGFRVGIDGPGRGIES
jgi:hypothetical protein